MSNAILTGANGGIGRATLEKFASEKVNVWACVRRENEDVVAEFLRHRPDFSPEPLPLPEVFPKNTSGMITLVPGEYDTDGFFICRLRRKP